jgi:excisionase family DNA binding protein
MSNVQHRDWLCDYLTTIEAAKKLHISPSGIRTAISNGKLKATKPFNRDWLIRNDWLEDYRQIANPKGNH